MSLRNKLSQGSLRDKAWWMNIKRAGGVSRSVDIPILSGPGGCEHVTSTEIADCFGAHYAEKCNLHNIDLTAESIPPFQSRCQSSITTVHFRESTVRRKIAAMIVSKASGPDGITCRVLKECAYELALPLLNYSPAVYDPVNSP